MAVGRRGVELSLNLVILIVIGLIAAALIIFFVTKSVTRGDADIGGCAVKGGHCEASAQYCGPDESASAFFTGGCNKGEICCVPQLQKEN